MKLTTFLHLVSSLGMSGTVPPLSLYGFMAWRGTAVLYMHFFGLKFLSDDLKERHSAVTGVWYQAVRSVDFYSCQQKQ